MELSELNIHNNSAEASYYVSGSEPFVLGHYPDDAIFPGVISIHLMRQMCDVLIDSLLETKHYRVTLKRVTFIEDIRPSNELSFTAVSANSKESTVKIDVLIKSGSREKVKAIFIYEF